MRHDITVSVVIPVYNAGPYLEDCLTSLVNQTLTDMELIAIDDGSTDQSGEILDRFAEKHPGLFTIIHRENRGQGSARNTGIELSRGRYIGFVDADDMVETEMYAAMYTAAVQGDCDLVECSYRFLQASKEGDKELRPYGHVRRYKSSRDMFLNPLVSPWNKLYRGELLRKKDLRFPEGVIYEDTSFFVKAIPYLNKWEYVENPFVSHYRRENSTMTGRKDVRVGDIFPVLEDIWCFYERMQLVAQYGRELEYFTAKILLCSSMERIAGVEHREVRNSLQKETLAYLSKRIPQYRKNAYIRNNALGWYMRLAGRRTLGIVCGILRIGKKLGGR